MNRPLFCVVFMMGCLFPSVLAQESLVIDEADRVQLPGNAHLPVPPESDIGRTNPNFRIQRMSVVLACSLRQPAEAIPVLPAQRPVWPGSLNPSMQQDCTVRHPELQELLPAVTSWLRSHGFVIELVRGRHSAIRFSGTVAQVEEAFRVEIHTYLVNGKTYYGNTINPSIPRRLSRLVLRVNALDDLPVANQTVSSSVGNETVLYSFTGTNGDGAQPTAGLIMDSAGNLYGTTQFGGVTSCFSDRIPPGCGTVFKLDPSGNETVLHSFTGTNGDGANPAASLIMDSAGNLYGTTQFGGVTSCSSGSFVPPGCGTVFKLDPSGHETVLYSFTLTNGDGAQPVAGLIMDSAGNLYGTTPYGGVTSSSCFVFVTGPPIPPGCGTVFKLDPSGHETLLHSFTDTNGDGAQPVAGLIMDSAGNLYGTVAASAGTVFRLEPSGHETVLHSFTGSPDGEDPVAGVIMDSAGNLYGTTYGGGSAGDGTVFRLEPPVDFSFGPGSGGSTSAAITAGQTATYNVQLNPAGGFSGSVSLTCSGAPAQATCSISPASVTVTGSSAVPFTVTITTTAATAMASSATGGSDSSPSGQRYAFLFACVLLAAIKLGTRRAGGKRAWAPIGSLVCLTIVLVACGSSSSSTGGSGGTPAGTYNLTVTGTSQEISHTLALTLTVK